MASVFKPLNLMISCCGTPARMRLQATVRRKSYGFRLISGHNDAEAMLQRASVLPLPPEERGEGGQGRE